MKIAQYLFDVCHNNKCIICKNDIIRKPVNELLYKRYRGEDLSLTSVLEVIERQYNVKAPSLQSLIRHFDNHLVYGLEHPSEISPKLIEEAKQRIRNKNTEETKEVKPDKHEASRDEVEIRDRRNAIKDGAKIEDVFPLTGYNSQKGINGPKLGWDEWCQTFITIRVNGELKPMKLAKHQIDALELIDKFPGLLLLIARNHRKSTILEIYTLRNLCDWQPIILYSGGSSAEVKRYTKNIRSALTNNYKILLYYGYLPMEGANSVEELRLTSANAQGEEVQVFDKDPNLSYTTPPKAGGGASKLGAHPDIIIMDDIQGEDVKEFDKLKRKHEDWFDKNIMPMRKSNTKIIIAGTRKSDDDIYHYIMEKKFLMVVQFPAIQEFPNEGQEEPIHGDDTKWDYIFETTTNIVGNAEVESTIVAGVKNLTGGKVFWDGFREENWNDRKIQYRKADGQFNRTLMALQELLLEKYMLEADDEKGAFAFSSEYQLDPVERKGRHFNTDVIKEFDLNKLRKIVRDQSILKYTWIDVGYSLPSKKTAVKRKGTKLGKTVFVTECRISGEEEGWSKEDEGVYLLDVLSGNFFLDDPDVERSLIKTMGRINETFHPKTFCFEENYFGLFIKENLKLFNESKLPVDGKTNSEDKYVRISNGNNAMLANENFYMCKMANGYQATRRQFMEFPHTSKIDEIDGVESCYRLLIKESDKVMLIGDFFAGQRSTEHTCKQCEKYDKGTNMCTETNVDIDGIRVCPITLEEIHTPKQVSFGLRSLMHRYGF